MRSVKITNMAKFFVINPFQWLLSTADDSSVYVIVRWDALSDLIPIVQSKQRKKHSWRSVYFI